MKNSTFLLNFFFILILWFIHEKAKKRSIPKTITFRTKVYVNKILQLILPIHRTFLSVSLPNTIYIREWKFKNISALLWWLQLKQKFFSTDRVPRWVKMENKHRIQCIRPLSKVQLISPSNKSLQTKVSSIPYFRDCLREKTVLWSNDVFYHFRKFPENIPIYYPIHWVMT